ncbi:hypothetical protein N656DRAFT_258991 [Canariomyces notabilis]|uniref:Uncharacterized protein n=1 Tax=Canariomyces notabilis TaxID=2074819 RepID=A0AAN6YWF5_9PEZI|nr:hypothetical protein N656DRAFT_258991 [Canariomyces arenarius]
MLYIHYKSLQFPAATNVSSVRTSPAILLTFFPLDCFLGSAMPGMLMRPGSQVSRYVLRISGRNVGIHISSASSEWKTPLPFVAAEDLSSPYPYSVPRRWIASHHRGICRLHTYVRRSQGDSGLSRTSHLRRVPIKAYIQGPHGPAESKAQVINTLRPKAVSEHVEVDLPSLCLIRGWYWND